MPVWIANQETLRGAEAFLGYCYRTWGDKPPARGPNPLRSRRRWVVSFSPEFHYSI